MTKMLEFVDQTLDQVPLSVEPSIILARLLAPRPGWDDRRRAGLENESHQRVRIVTAVGNDMLKGHSLQQGFGLGYVVTFAACETETQRIAQPVHRDVDFGTKPASASSQRLNLLPAAFFVRQRRRDERGR